MNAQLRSRAVIHAYRASGPGGQHRNKRETAVRAVDPVTGVSAVATESRSQAENRETALQRLEEKVARLHFKPKPRIPTRKRKGVRNREREARERHSRKKRERRGVSLED